MLGTTAPGHHRRTEDTVVAEAGRVMALQVGARLLEIGLAEAVVEAAMTIGVAAAEAAEVVGTVEVEAAIAEVVEEGTAGETGLEVEAEALAAAEEAALAAAAEAAHAECVSTGKKAAVSDPTVDLHMKMTEEAVADVADEVAIEAEVEAATAGEGEVEVVEDGTTTETTIEIVGVEDETLTETIGGGPGREGGAAQEVRDPEVTNEAMIESYLTKTRTHPDQGLEAVTVDGGRGPDLATIEKPPSRPLTRPTPRQ